MQRDDHRSRRSGAADRAEPGSSDGRAADDALPPAEDDDPSDLAPDIASDAALAGGASPTADDLQRQLAEQQDRYLRLAAEYDNYRRRTARERTEAQARGQAELVKQLLDPLDDLSRFAHHDPATLDLATVVQGADMVERKLHKLLAAAGLEAIDPLHQTFDPTVMEAVATEPALSPEDDHVVGRVFQQGYVFNGQLLRPARVVVKQWNG
jgi:molecular chaperone GrpE